MQKKIASEMDTGAIERSIGLGLLKRGVPISESR